ncbi:UMP-CMP kinase 2, mitochondrial-like [Macrosteles quadrilineatus]|uniref:UMP-CMP kinase 2, mitochondrial-like n=1 Tax=Macrosteles quadrilineatus TaxID=74068 RepID=UPI0023E23345|nr:UMP-CMP kinase 2, mitochondrial-like [Macrosteles quadrilineatus]
MNLLSVVILCVQGIIVVLAQQSHLGDNIPIFYNLRQVLDVFHSKEHAGRQDTQRILYAFENYCFSQYTRSPPGKRKPFVVVEGDHKTSTDIISRRLAKRLGATLLQNVAKCLEGYKRVFPQGDPLRRAFYGLSMYAVAHKAKLVYHRFPVVANGYWVEQTVFGVGNKHDTVEDIPTRGSAVYTWPSDLLKPDLLVYVTFPDNFHKNIGTTRAPNSWKQRLEYIYQQIEDPPVIIKSTAQGFDNITAELENTITDMFSDTLDCNFTPNEM